MSDKKKAPKRGRGRPSKFTPALAEEIIEARGKGLSQRKICAEEGMPSGFTLRKWLNEKPEFSLQYAQAFRGWIEDRAEESLQIAEQHNDVQRARLIVDTVKWLSCKLVPRVYGEQVKVQHDGKIEVEIVKNW